MRSSIKGAKKTVGVALTECYLKLGCRLGTFEYVAFRLRPSCFVESDASHCRFLAAVCSDVNRLHEVREKADDSRNCQNGAAHQLHRRDELLKFSTSFWCWKMQMGKREKAKGEVQKVEQMHWAYLTKGKKRPEGRTLSDVA